MPQMNADRQWRVYRVIDMTRGLAIPPAADSQAEQFQNFEVLGDGSIVSRLGAFRANASPFNNNPIVGFHRTVVRIQGSLLDTLVVMKQGTTWYYATAPFGTRQIFQPLTVPQDPGLNVVVGENALNLSETQLALFASPGFAPGICAWDGTNFTTIAQSPNHVRFLRQYNQTTYAVTIDQPNRVWFSNNSDPTTWAQQSYFDIPAHHGPITGLERFAAGTLLIFCTNAIFGVFGDPTQSQETVEVLHDAIGCDTPNSVFTVEAGTVFAFRGCLYLFSGTVQEQAPLLRGITRAIDTPPPGGAPQVLVAINSSGGVQGYTLNPGTGAVTAAGGPAGSNAVALVTDPIGFYVFSISAPYYNGFDAYSISALGQVTYLANYNSFYIGQLYYPSGTCLSGLVDDSGQYLYTCFT